MGDSTIEVYEGMNAGVDAFVLEDRQDVQGENGRRMLITTW